MKRKLAILDDNEMMRTFLTTYLQREFEVVSFSESPKFLDWINEADMPDALVLDLKMPEKSGWDVLQELREKGKTPSLKVMVVSGIESSTERVRCLELGASDYIIKPFNPQELALRLNRLVA